MKLDDLMQQSLVETPADFTQTILHHIEALPTTRQQKAQTNWLTWLAVAGSGLLGLSQLFGFVFSLWTVTTAN